MEIHPENFLGIGPPFTDLDKARAVLLPVPYDRTATYGKGTARGPEGLIAASCSLELYDEELDRDTYKLGIHTAPPVSGNEDRPEKMVRQVEAAGGRDPEMWKLVVTGGGEHSLTP